MTYEESEAMAYQLAEHLIKIYYEGVNRKKVNAEEMLSRCPHFIVETWGLMVKKIMENQDEH